MEESTAESLRPLTPLKAVASSRRVRSNEQDFCPYLPETTVLSSSPETVMSDGNKDSNTSSLQSI
jgi:hypothetical protein